MAKRQRQIILGAAALVGLAAVILLTGSFGNRWEELEFYTVEEGEFVLDVVVRGELKSERSRSIAVPPAIRVRSFSGWPGNC